MARQFIQLALAAVLATGTMAFQLPLPGSSKPLRPLQAGRGDQQQPQQQPQPSRRDLMQSAAAVLGALGVAGLFAPAPLPAQAASPVISELKIRESVKGVKDSADALKLYEDFVTQKDFYGIKKSLRVPPVSDIRRDCRRIIAGLDGEPKKQLDSAYGQFITSLEEVDLIATRAIQADNTISDEDLKKLATKYGETETRLDAVLKLVLETRYAQTDVNVRLETSATGL